MTVLLSRPLDPTPPRPTHRMPPPMHQVRMVVDVEVAHLANPLVAVSRLLASEASAFAHVEGDDERFTVTVALPGDGDETARSAEEWIRWAVHNAGVRGTLRRIRHDPGPVPGRDTAPARR